MLTVFTSLYVRKRKKTRENRMWHLQLQQQSVVVYGCNNVFCTTHFIGHDCLDACLSISTFLFGCYRSVEYCWALVSWDCLRMFTLFVVGLTKLLIKPALLTESLKGLHQSNHKKLRSLIVWHECILIMVFCLTLT